MAWNGNHDRIGTMKQSGELLLQEKSEDECYLVARPECRHPFFYLFNLRREGRLAQTSAPDHVYAKMNGTTSWQERLSLFFMQTLAFLSPTMNAVGWILEFAGNILIANGGLLPTLFRILCSAGFVFKKGPLVVPNKEAAQYLSLIGMLDPRKALLIMETNSSTPSRTESAVEGDPNARKEVFPGPGNGDRGIADVMLMAAKFAYENEALIKEVVTNEWKMNFVGAYNCWNEYQQRFNQQAFIFTDKAQDANAVVLSWRGTRPFSALDWSTDFDFSWYDLQGGAGKVPVGFLEALGLGDRHDMNTFAQLRTKSLEFKRQDKKRSLTTGATETQPPPAASGLPQGVIDAPDKILAYDYLTQVVKELLEKNPNAKLYITGHSLGGALTMLYTGMLYYFGENAVTERIAALYTLGQPRAGDEEFGNFMVETLTVERYFRVVYCNDLFPRVPFDNSLFQFKHWGLCYYFSSILEEQTLKEEPNPNYFSISEFFSIHLNALWELLNSPCMSFKYGPDYKESTACLLVRILALIVPGLGDHSIVNYHNALRLGKPIPLVAPCMTRQNPEQNHGKQLPGEMKPIPEQESCSVRSLS